MELEEEMDEETAAKHAAFVRARGRHYSNEAEAMKRAAQMMDEDDDDDEAQGGPRQSGSAFIDADEEVEAYTEGPSYDEPSEAEVAPTVNGVHEDKR